MGARQSEAVACRASKYAVAQAIVISFGGFIFGYDLGALSSATQSLRSHFQLSPAIFGTTISFSLWGTVVGSVLAGRWADRMNRRTLIEICAVLYALAAVGVTLPAPSEWAFILSMRFVCGVAIGGFTVACPLYLAELAPSGLRGRFVSLFQVQIGFGVVVAFAAGSIFVRLSPPSEVWRWCLGAGTVPAALLLLLLRVVFRDASTMTGSARATVDKAAPASSVVSKCSDEQRLFRGRNKRVILLATSIAVFNQLSGVNILLLYVLDILSSAGIGLRTGHTYTVLISCLSLATTVLGMLMVDRAGRKPLLYVGSVGMAICLLCLAVAIPYRFAPLVYLSILVAYNALFAFSQGTVVWVYLSELFPPGIRGAGQGYGAFVHWITNATLVLVFPIMHHASSVRIFYVFALMMALQMVVIWRWYPETRGATLGLFATDGMGRHHTCSNEIG